MVKQEKIRLEEKRKLMSLNTMYFNRFLLVRYMTAVMFFSNLYWFFSLILSNVIWWIIPCTNLLIMIKAIYEQFSMNGSVVDEAPNTMFLFKFISIINLILLIIVIPTQLFNELFPFLRDSIESRKFIGIIIFSGLILCTIVLKRLQKIKYRADRQLQRIKQYEKAIK